MDTRILTAIKYIKRCLTTFKLKRNVEQMLYILNLIEHNTQIDIDYHILKINSLGKSFLEQSKIDLDITYYICGCIESILETLKNTNDTTLNCMEQEISRIQSLYDEQQIKEET